MTDHQQSQTPLEKFREGAESMMGDDDPEVAIWSGGFSPKSMAGAWMAAIAVTILALILVAATPLRNTPYVWWGLLIVLLIGWGVLVGTYLYRRLGMSYQLTSQRLKHREGIFMRKLDRIELIDIDDVTYHQGPIQAMLNVGNIMIKSSDASHPELVLYGISEIRTVADQIDDARRAERRKRGLHIESV